MRGFLIYTTRVVVTLGLLYLALRGINFATIQSRLTQINLLWIALAVLVTIFQLFLGALRCDGLVAPCVFDGPINGECFLAYVEQQLVPSLKSGDIVILYQFPERLTR